MGSGSPPGEVNGRAVGLPRTLHLLPYPGRPGSYMNEFVGRAAITVTAVDALRRYVGCGRFNPGSFDG